MFKWQPGIQNTGYNKIRIFEFKNMDCYIIRYPVGSRIPLHKDPVENKKHYRITLIKPSKRGGIFYCDKTLYRNRYLVFFRPDLHTHCVTEVKEKSRYVLSIGWTI